MLDRWIDGWTALHCTALDATGQSVVESSSEMHQIYPILMLLQVVISRVVVVIIGIVVVFLL